MVGNSLTSKESVKEVLDLIDHNKVWVGLQEIDREAYDLASDTITTLVEENNRLRDEVTKLEGERIDL